MNWWFWLLGRGRFSRPGGPGDRSTVAHYVGTFVGQVITEFRHLLALVVVTLFAVTMATVIVLARDDFEKVKAGVQLVAASLGGLIGSIIGYYFGESAARQRAADVPAATAPALVQQLPPGPGPLPPAPGAPPVSPVQPPRRRVHCARKARCSPRSTSRCRTRRSILPRANASC